MRMLLLVVLCSTTVHALPLPDVKSIVNYNTYHNETEHECDDRSEGLDGVANFAQHGPPNPSMSGEWIGGTSDRPHPTGEEGRPTGGWGGWGGWGGKKGKGGGDETSQGGGDGPTTSTKAQTQTHVQTNTQADSETNTKTDTETQGGQPTQSVGGDSSGDSGGGASGEAAQMLQLHNDFRAQHGAGDLTWSDTLASYASNYASKCVFKHSGGQYGENLAAGTGSYSVSAGFQAWANEAKDYDPSNPTYSHFTQVVWKGSKQLGCTITPCGASTIFDAASQYVICEYDPPGNSGDYADNVQA